MDIALEVLVSDSQISFGQRVSELAKARGVTQTELADKVGIDRTVLSRIMNDRRAPQSDEIIWIAEALGETVEALLDGVELPEPSRRDLERVQDLARRVLAAEQERDAAKAETQALREAMAGEQQQASRVLQEVRAEQRSALDSAHDRLQRAEREWRGRVDQIAQERDGYAARVAQLEGQLAACAAVRRQQQQRIEQLQGQMTQVREGAGQAALLVGLLGLGVGSAISKG